MKSGFTAGMSLLIAAFLLSFLAPADPSSAVTFPVTYSGTTHVRATVGTGGCEGDAQLKITLTADGKVTGSTDVMISVNGLNSCSIVSVDSLGWSWWSPSGTHDKAGAFTLIMDFVTVTGTFDDKEITGTGSGSSVVSATYSFALPNTSCGAKIPLPTGIQVFSPDRSANPRLGTTPATINPLGVGALALPLNFSAGNLDRTANFRISFCPFEKPVDIYVAYSGAATWYLLDSSNKAYSVADGLKPWKGNVSASINATISPDFGGLFPVPGKMPKGDNMFLVFVLPAGAGIENAYVWMVEAPVSCGTGNTIPAPTKQEVFFYDPVAVPLDGTNPAAIRPLAVGPAALGGSMIHLYADPCPFSTNSTDGVDTHFGMICASDPDSLFFLRSLDDPRITIKSDLLQELPLAGTTELAEPCKPNDRFDEIQEDPNNFYGDLGSRSHPDDLCYYIFGVTPHNVRDKFYLWATPLRKNIKNSLLDFWWEERQP